MITRIFRAKVAPDLHEEFREKFKAISVPQVSSAKGLKSLCIGGPSRWNTEEFAMISVWENEEALKEFAGEKWNKPYIPEGMEKYISECWLDHYEGIDF